MSRRSEGPYSKWILGAPFFYLIVESVSSEMYKMKKNDNLYCPECEKLNRRIRLVRDECPECHYKHLIIKG